MTVLFSVGAGKDEPSVIPTLLDIHNHPSKPGYPLAPPEPLVLSHCEYLPDPFGHPPGQNYMTSPGSAFTNSVETSLISVCHAKLGIETVIPDSSHFFRERQMKDNSKSILTLHRGKTLAEQIDGLKGNKKKRSTSSQKQSCAFQPQIF